MAVSLASIGTASVATTSPLSTPYPASIASTDLLLHLIASKFVGSAHTTPSGFNFLDTETAGFGSEDGSDRGSVVASAFDRIADGSETGNLSTTWTGLTGGSVAMGVIARLTRSGGSGFEIVTTTARWTTDNTNPISVTFDDAIDFAVDDYCLIFYGNNSDNPTNITPVSLTASGITFSSPTTQRWDKTLDGGDMGIAYVDAVVTAGSGTVAPSFSANKNASNVGEGPLIFIRIRESAGGGNTFTASGALVGGGAVVTGSASRSRIHSATGSLQAGGAAISGSAARSRVHSASGALQAAGAVIDGAASKAGNLSASGALVGGGAAVAGVAARSRVRTASGDLVGGGAAVSGTATRTEPGSLSASGVLIGGGAAMSGAAVLRRLHSASGALSGAGATIAGVAARSGVFAPTVTLRLFATPAGSSVVASATGIEWAWYDNATTLLEALADTPTVTGSGASSDASGYLSLTLTGSTKTTGERGFLLFSDCTGAVDENPRTFGAMVEVD